MGRENTMGHYHRALNTGKKRKTAADTSISDTVSEPSQPHNCSSSALGYINEQILKGKVCPLSFIAGLARNRRQNRC